MAPPLTVRLALQLNNNKAAVSAIAVNFIPVNFMIFTYSLMFHIYVAKIYIPEWKAMAAGQMSMLSN
jgi:hypothetical protein